MAGVLSYRVANPSWRRTGRTTLLVLAAIAPAALASSAVAQTVARSDAMVAGPPGIAIFVREVVGRATSPNVAPLLLVHDTPAAGAASFDLGVPGGSLAADLAALGLRVYLMDARGYGRSSRAPRLANPPRPGVPLTRASEVVEDIEAVVGWIRQRTRAPKVALLGWGAGGHAVGQFAARRPDVVAAVVFYNTLYGGGPDHPLVGRASEIADRARPGRINRATLGAYRLYDATAILKPWDQSIPGPDKAAWRDPQVAAAYASAVLAADPGAPPQRPPAVRVPTGALADAFEVTMGRQAWDAGLVRAPALIVFSEKDFWSRAEDRDRLQAHLVNAGEVKVVTLPGATHFAHLDRPERGRQALIDALKAFLLKAPTSAPAPAPRPAG
jgi:pimeloyl-ACP methyl ester carboxylesterase